MFELTLRSNLLASPVDEDMGSDVSLSPAVTHIVAAWTEVRFTTEQLRAQLTARLD